MRKHSTRRAKFKATDQTTLNEIESYPELPMNEEELSMKDEGMQITDLSMHLKNNNNQDWSPNNNNNFATP